MKNRLLDSGGITRNVFFVLAIMICFNFFTPRIWAAYSDSPRQTGEIVLDEILMGSNQFVIRIASNGYTEKNSFQVDIQKDEGLSAKTPYYKLTIIRIKPDEGKAIVEGGVLIRFDLETDLELKGELTYTVTNKVMSSSQMQPQDQSLLSIIEKYFTSNFPQLSEINPEPFEKFVMDHEYRLRPSL